MMDTKPFALLIVVAVCSGFGICWFTMSAPHCKVAAAPPSLNYAMKGDRVDRWSSARPEFELIPNWGIVPTIPDQPRSK